jgi:predicted  nucleic acid-binding Zn-ribbon protein
MQEQLQQRLASLREEFAAGQKVLAELENRQADLRQTLLRISGAIQVLEEVLQSEVRGAAAPGEG